MSSFTVSAEGGGSKFAPHPTGMHPGRAIRVIDLGTQDGEWQGKPKKTRKVMVTFESSALMPDGEKAGQPFLVSLTYTANLGEKANLRKDLEGWRGRPFTEAELKAFDLKNIIDKTALLNVIHTEKGNAKIKSINPLPTQMTCPPAVNPLVLFSLQDFDKAVFSKLSARLQETIAKSPEYREVAGHLPTGGASAPAGGDDFGDDEIPF